MTLLPEQWEQIHLGELAALKTSPFGSTLHKSDYRTGGIPVVNPMHIVGGKIVPSAAVTVAPETAERLSEFQLQRGDVVLGRRGDMGRCAVVGEAEHGWLCGTGSLIVRPGTALDPHYLQRFLSSPSVVSRLEEASVGSTMVNLNQRILLALEVPIPPLAEQKRIADKLEAVLARVDACRKHLDRVPDILKRFRQAVLAAATSGKLTEKWRASDEVEAWQTVKLSEVAKSRLGKMLDKAKNQGAATPYLRNINVRWFGFDLSDIQTIRVTEDEVRDLAVERGDVLICEGGEPGRCAMWQGENGAYVYQKALHRVRVGPALTPEWLCYSLKDAADSGRLTDLFTGTTIKHLTGVALGQFEFLLPPLREQHEIIRRVEALFAYTDRLEARYTAVRAQVERLTPALLAKAFRGELVPQDPNDEPSSVLLERIRTRAAAGEKPPSKMRTERRPMTTTPTTETTPSLPYLPIGRDPVLQVTAVQADLRTVSEPERP